jgi:hypothetical protein
MESKTTIPQALCITLGKDRFAGTPMKVEPVEWNPDPMLGSVTIDYGNRTACIDLNYDWGQTMQVLLEDMSVEQMEYVTNLSRMGEVRIKAEFG